ncbi:hypothetical protein [Anaerobacillus sp. 1_MG-2023]|uniref:hypothetical protein n=1 Tax=Bacillales TaxID=1385 RepID=UPI0026E42F66|nr:hypothetical protein [Anaerobacillus sp. 1_MG-2023]MDO6657183.1 hypothetical protein [Anaerobacillus sp. 1_MG-2023]
MYLRKIAHNQVFKNLLFTIGLSVISSWYYIGYANAVSSETSSIGMLIFLTYSSLEFSSIKHVIPVLIWMLPQFFLVYILGQSINNSFRNNAKYIFTRTNNRTKWLMKNVNQLFLNNFLFFIVHFSVVILMGYLNGMLIKTSYGLLIIGVVFFLQVSVSYLLLLVINISSLFFNLTYSYAVILSLHIFSIMIIGIIGELTPQYLVLCKWLPVSHIFLAWHDLKMIEDFQSILTINYIQRFDLIFSIGYLLVCYLVIIWISIARIKKIDIY